MWFGADSLLHSPALPPCSPVWDINTAAVSGRALTFSRCREVTLCRQISQRGEIHHGEGENSTLANSEILLVLLGNAGVCSSHPVSLGRTITAAETWGQWVRNSWSNRTVVPGEGDGGNGKGKVGRGDL